jgi:hypothetical protein
MEQGGKQEPRLVAGFAQPASRRPGYRPALDDGVAAIELPPNSPPTTDQDHGLRRAASAVGLFAVRNCRDTASL